MNKEEIRGQIPELNTTYKRYSLRIERRNEIRTLSSHHDRHVMLSRPAKSNRAVHVVKVSLQSTRALRAVEFGSFKVEHDDALVVCENVIDGNVVGDMVGVDVTGANVTGVDVTGANVVGGILKKHR